MEIKFSYGNKHLTAEKVIWDSGYRQTFAKVGNELIPIKHVDGKWMWTGVLPPYYSWLLMHI